LIAKVSTRFQLDAPRWCNKNDMRAGGHQPGQSIVAWSKMSRKQLYRLQSTHQGCKAHVLEG
jgi:hypothetical protein